MLSSLRRNLVSNIGFINLRQCSSNTNLSKIYSAQVFEVKNPNQLAESIKSLPNLTKYLENAEKYVKEIEEIKKQSLSIVEKHLCNKTVKVLKSLGTKSDALSNFIIIKKFPFTQIENVTQAEQVLLGLSKIISLYPFSFANEKNGRIPHHVRPTEDKQNEYHSSSSKGELTLHTENSFDYNDPDYLVLYCLKSNKNAATRFVTSKQIIDSLPENERDEIISIGLRNKFFHYSPPSFDMESVKNQSQVFFYNQNSKIYPIELRLDKLTKGIDEESNKILPKLMKHASEQASEVVLESGDVCIWNNHFLMHGRSAYKTDFSDDKNKRFLLRLYLSKNPDLPMIRR